MSNLLSQVNANSVVVINITGEDRTRNKINFSDTLSVGQLGINLSVHSGGAVPPRPTFPQAALSAIASDLSLTPADRTNQTNALMNAHQQELTSWESRYGSTPVEDRLREGIRNHLSSKGANYDPNKLQLAATRVGENIVITVTGTASSGF